MSWTEAQVDELINNVRRDFALNRLNRIWELKLREHGVSLRDAERAIGKHSYIGQYENKGLTIGFLNPRNNVFVAWSPNIFHSYVKTCFIADGGLDYLLRQDEIELIWSPK
jgi:hypothetical protein